MLGEEGDTARGVLKMNCRVLEPGQLKRLDKLEKSLAQEIHTSGKGKQYGQVGEKWEGSLTQQFFPQFYITDQNGTVNITVRL